MKKLYYKRIILTAALSLILLLTACSGTPDTTRDSTDETIPPQETTTQPSTEKSTTELPTTGLPTKEQSSAEQSTTESVTGKEEQRFNVRELKYGFLLKDVDPDGEIKANASLPDSLQKSIGKTKDKEEGDQYYIVALDLTLEIPEGYHLYRVDGLYRDSEGKPIRLEFVDEYILALRDVSEEELIREIYAYEEKDYQNVRPHWILWNFKIFHKDYLPVEQLFSSRIEVSGELRKAGEYWVETGTQCGWFEMEDGFYKSLNCPEYRAVAEKYYGFGKPDPTEKELEALNKELDSNYDWPLRIAADQWYTDEFMQAVLNASAGCGVEYNYQQNEYTNSSYYDSELLFLDDGPVPFIGVLNPAASIASEGWWKDYCLARAELESDPEKYVCPEIPISFETDAHPEEPWLSRQKEQFAGWQQNPANEKVVRAAVYSWLKATGRETSLENIVIYMKDSPMNAPFFLAITMDPDDNCRLTPVMKGMDVLSTCDMEQAREYAGRNVKFIP